jgi:hypothetical protein
MIFSFGYLENRKKMSHPQNQVGKIAAVRLSENGTGTTRFLGFRATLPRISGQEKHLRRFRMLGAVGIVLCLIRAAP